jgi:tetratricopeptide (TPR) repeat protein
MPFTPVTDSQSAATLEGLRLAVQQAMVDAAWPEAEGLLRRFSQLVEPVPIQVFDALAYTLLMQGDYQGCLRVLLPLQEHPERSFWLHHKLADALRGLNRLPEAVEAYRRSLADGSDSALTWRNLLQCLYGIDPQQAVAELQSWRDVPAAAWEGAGAAALLVSGIEIAEQLWRCGQADAATRRRLLEEALYRLDLPRALALLERHQADPSPWESALADRLQGLGFKQPPPATSAPGAAARFRSAAPG